VNHKGYENNYQNIIMPVAEILEDKIVELITLFYRPTFQPQA
jgi:hypothetical protein